jgi:hypothetical protein
MDGGRLLPRSALRLRHIAEFFAWLGGGLKDAGWQNTQFSNARLSIIPGYSHYNFGTAPELGVTIEKFLDDPMTKTRGGEAAAASKGFAMKRARRREGREFTIVIQKLSE